MALYTVVFIGSTPIGGPIAGWVGEHVGAHLGPRVGLVGGGAIATPRGSWPPVAVAWCVPRMGETSGQSRRR
jgi:hypothetical protein